MYIRVIQHFYRKRQQYSLIPSGAAAYKAAALFASADFYLIPQCSSRYAIERTPGTKQVGALLLYTSGISPEDYSVADGTPRCRSPPSPLRFNQNQIEVEDNNMFDRKSGHAINKKENDAIVYADAYGNITRLTAKDFSSEQEFRKWKDLLTEVNHLEEKEDHVFRNHNVSLSPFTESAAKIPSVENRMIAAEERQAHIQKTIALMAEIREKISELQYRRLWMYYIDGYSTHEIALWEGNSHQAISKSIRAAQKNMFQIAGNRVAKSLQKRR